MTLYDQLQSAVSAIRQRIGAANSPTVGLILGSGLGGYADSLEDPIRVPYSEIPGFPESTVVGHSGQLVVGRKHGVRCVAMQGRVHFYEGHDAATAAFPARALIALGARTLIITNAAGGIRPEWPPGTLMLIKDHINMLPGNPLRGPNDERLGPRFPDMTHVYPEALRDLARRAAQSIGCPLQEGVYVAMPGPTYETPAEIRMLSTMGADATGMSTVPEAIVASHMGAEVLGLSCITNAAAGLSGESLSHEEVTETATRVRATFESLIDAVIDELRGRHPA